MGETIGLLLLLASCYWIGYTIYHHGKATGSRKGYHVGRSRRRRR